MEAKLLNVFQRQVWTQCEFFVFSNDDFNKAYEDADSLRAWHAIQGMVVCVGNLSKLFWGQDGSRSQARNPLRISLQVSSDKSPIRNIQIRNSFEHFDERIERWWKNSLDHEYHDQNFGILTKGSDEFFPVGPGDNQENMDVFRHYNPETGELIFWEAQINLKEINAEIRRILPIARHVSQQEVF